MPTNLPDQNWTVPAGTDLADNPFAFTDYSADVIRTVVLRYPNTATRDAFNGSRIAGDISFTTGNTWYERWTGAKWIPATSIRKFKVVDQIVNNSTVLVNDAELFVPLPAANTQYAFRMGIRYNTNATADIKFTFTGPAGTTIAFGGSGPDVASAATTNATSNYAEAVAPGIAAFGGGAVTSSLTLHGSVTTAAAIGNLTLQWAQNTLNASNTTVSGFSYMILEAIA